MIRLNQNNISLLNGVIESPTYDRSKVKTGIVHIGVGGFHRAHQAVYCDNLLAQGHDLNWGICGVALLERDHKIYNTLKDQDGLYTLIVKRLDGSWSLKIIGSITEYLFAPENSKRVIEKIADVATKIVTLTITEGGYNIDETTGEFNLMNPLIQHDIAHPDQPKTVFGYLTQALKIRKANESIGCTIQSCDNVEGNGEVMKHTLISFIKVAEPDLLQWVEENISFPSSMVDRITPVTEEKDILRLKTEYGIDDNWPVTCEPFIQWVISDNFKAGRPRWEDLGVEFVDDVTPYEKMKLQLLNAGHSVIGILGALLGYKTIDQAISDKSLRKFLINFMEYEVTPTLSDLSGIDLPVYKKSLIERFGNQNIKDQISRICSESSAKLPKFLFPTLRQQLKNRGSVYQASLVIAAWAIFSKGIDEQGNNLNIIDVLKEELKEKAFAAKDNSKSFLDISSVFGDLNSSERFVKAFIEAYDKLVEVGVKKTIDDFNCSK